MKPSKGRRYWRRQIEQWKHSGLSQSAYCREHGLSLSTFNSWQRKLGSTAKPKSKPENTSIDFAKVEIAPSANLPATIADPVTITLPNGISLSVPPRFDEASLKRVIATCRSL